MTDTTQRDQLRYRLAQIIHVRTCEECREENGDSIPTGSLPAADAVLAALDERHENMPADIPATHAELAEQQARDATTVETPDQWVDLFLAEPRHRQLVVAGKAMDAADRMEAAEGKLAEVRAKAEAAGFHGLVKILDGDGDG